MQYYKDWHNVAVHHCLICGPLKMYESIMVIWSRGN